MLNVELDLGCMFGHTYPIDAPYLSGGLNMDIYHHHGFEHGWQFARINFVGVFVVDMPGRILAVFYGVTRG